MKVLVNIQDEEYEKICKISEAGIKMEILECIANGTPIVDTKVSHEKVIAKKGSEYVKKGYYNLTEENYWYLKDITFYNCAQIQDYLNHLIEKDRSEHKDILHLLPHNNLY